MTQANARSAHGIRTLGVVVAIGALAFAFRDTDFSRAGELCMGIGGAGLMFALLPQLLAVLFETRGWQIALTLVGYRVRLRALFVIRVSTESLSLCMPAGALFAESLKVPLFARHAGFSAAQALVAITLRKYIILAAQSAYLIAAAALLARAGGFPALGGQSFPFWLVVAGFVLGSVAFAGRVLLGRGRLGCAFLRRLRRLPNGKLRAKLAAAEEAASKGDRDFARFFRQGLHRELPSLCFAFATWSCEALETFVLLRLLGVTLDVGHVAAMEVTLSLLQNALFVLPAGIGVKDAGYALFLRALGVSGAPEVAAAFVLLKRSKELVWTLVGLALLTPTAREPKPAQ